MYSRKLGANIFEFMEKANYNRKTFAQALGCSYRDVCRMIEGKTIIAPAELGKVASVLGTDKSTLMHCETPKTAPELQYMKQFSNPDNLDAILDLLDEYIALQEEIAL